MTRPTPPAAPSTKTVKRLFAVSGNRCAFPKCRVELVRDGTILAEICHIKAARPNGSRYDALQSDEERHAFENLILLCGVHHTVVDDDEVSYTVGRLTEMKRSHESMVVPLSNEVLAAGAVALSVNQSGGIAAGVVHAQTINVHPPAPVTPQDVARGEAALRVFGPELARILAQQIHVLDRATVNFVCSSRGQAMPNDHRSTFKPWKPVLYPAAADFRDLSSTDAASLVEFYDSLLQVDDLLRTWEDASTDWDTNLWNVLMQTIEHSVGVGLSAARRFCRGRAYSPTVPAAGTLIDCAERSRAGMRAALEAHIARFQQRERDEASKTPPPGPAHLRRR